MLHSFALYPTLLLLTFFFAIAPGAASRCQAGAAAETAGVVEKDASVFTFNLHYREAGKGPAVILLHGLGGDGSRWTRTMTELAGELRVIAPDLIGFGQSDKPLADYNHAMLAEFLAEFMNRIEVPKASVLGHSMGGFVAMHLAVHRPELVDRIILLDGGDLNPAPRTEHLERIQNSTTLAETREYFEMMFYDKGRVTDEMVRDNLARRLRVSYTISKMQEARRKGVARITEEQAKRITAPTLVLWGRQDELLEPSIAESLQRAIPNSRLLLIDNCGHIPQIEQPDEFHRHVREFLRAK